MDAFDYCELWWSRGMPLVTFYGPKGTETVLIGGNETTRDRTLDLIRDAMNELTNRGWELLAMPDTGNSLLFTRHLQ